jgi:hypothetical protein
MNLFFGPSRQFKPIFKRALLASIKFKTLGEKGLDGKSQVTFFNLAEEPIFSQILHNMALGQGQKLKHKARI